MPAASCRPPLPGRLWTVAGPFCHEFAVTHVCHEDGARPNLTPKACRVWRWVSPHLGAHRWLELWTVVGVSGPWRAVRCPHRKAQGSHSRDRRAQGGRVPRAAEIPHTVPAALALCSHTSCFRPWGVVAPSPPNLRACLVRRACPRLPGSREEPGPGFGVRESGPAQRRPQAHAPEFLGVRGARAQKTSLQLCGWVAGSEPGGLCTLKATDVASSRRGAGVVGSQSPDTSCLVRALWPLTFSTAWV